MKNEDSPEKDNYGPQNEHIYESEKIKLKLAGYDIHAHLIDFEVTAIDTKN